jgi:hypothetical protein
MVNTKRQQDAVKKKSSFAETARVITVNTRLLCKITIGHLAWSSVVVSVAVCSSRANVS